MMYATETVLALHRARIADERRDRSHRRPRREAAAPVPFEGAAIRPAVAR